MRNTVTFEIVQPVQEMFPQWIMFVHHVNKIVSDGGGVKPFGMPLEETSHFEHYADATITHSSRKAGTLKIGIVIFTALNAATAHLFGIAAERFGEANMRIIDGKHWGHDSHPGDFYERKRAMAADASRALCQAENDCADDKTIRKLTAELDAARYVGD